MSDVIVFADTVRPVRILHPSLYKRNHDIIVWDQASGKDKEKEYTWMPSKRIVRDINMQSDFVPPRPIKIPAIKTVPKDIIAWSTRCTRGEIVYDNTPSATDFTELNVITWDEKVNEREEKFLPTRKQEKAFHQTADGAEVAVCMGRKDLEWYCKDLKIPKRLPGQVLPNDESQPKGYVTRPFRSDEHSQPTWYDKLVGKPETI